VISERIAVSGLNSRYISVDAYFDSCLLLGVLSYKKKLDAC